MTSPEITVIIPAHDSAAFVRDAIDSALDHVHVDVEVVVVDDRSQDATADVVSAYGAPVRLVSHSANRGAAAARNTGADAARSDLVMFLDSDDVLDPGCLDAIVAAARARPDVAMLVPTVRVTALDGETVIVTVTPEFDGPLDLHAVLSRALSPHPLIAVRRSATSDLPGPFREGSLAEDLEFWIAAGRAGIPTLGVPEASATYRGRPSSLSKNAQAVWRSGRAAYLDPGSHHPDCETCRRAARIGVSRLRDYCFGLDLEAVFGAGVDRADRIRSAALSVRRDPVLAPRLAYAAAWRTRDRILRRAGRTGSTGSAAPTARG